MRAHRTEGAIRLAPGLVVAAVVVAAAVGLGGCATVTDEAPADVTDTDDHPPTRQGPVVEPPDRTELPPLDRSVADVDLADVHFDTFDGGSVPLSEASPELVERLRDQIPPIHRPRYVRVSAVDHLEADDLVLGYVTDAGEAFAYPARILNFHEIVNEEIDGVPLVVTYCPLCRSGVVYDRRLDDVELTFGNTSALHDADLVMYDHQTNSYWWQVAGRAIVGDLTGAELDVLPSSTTTWADWIDRYPHSWVLSFDTGHDRPYERVHPFAGYRAQVNRGRFPFPVDEEAAGDDRLDAAEEVLGVVIEDEARAYPLRTLGDAVVNDELGGVPLLVISRAEGPTGTVFDRRVDGDPLTFEVRDGAVVDEETGSTWTVDGLASDGPLEGTQLEALPSRFSFWFAFVASFPEATVARP